MAPRRRWAPDRWVLTGAGLVVVLLAVVFVVPRLLYPPLPASRFAGVAPDRRIELETNRLKLQNDTRATLAQILAGGILLLGAYLTWRQLGVTREGQITDRYTKAVDQLGSEHLDVRLGGIYALERIANDSPADRSTIAEVLTAFVRGHAHWPNGPAELERPSPLQAAPADVQGAVTVLGRRRYPVDLGLNLTAVDLGEANLAGADLQLADLSFANLQDADLTSANLEGADLSFANLRTTLPGANLRGASLFRANLQAAMLLGANLQDAIFEGADLQHAVLIEANLGGAQLEDAKLEGARADEHTRWPEGWTRETAEARGVRYVA